MRYPTPANYSGVDMTAPILAHATPAAELTKLIEADAWLVDAATTPYCGCGRVFDMGDHDVTDDRDRWFAQVIAPGAVHGRMAITRSWVGGGHQTWTKMPKHKAFTEDGGETANELITLNWKTSASSYPKIPVFNGANYEILQTGNEENHTPNKPVDRLFELQTLPAAYVEPCFVTLATGVSMAVSQMVGDLEGLL